MATVHCNKKCVEVAVYKTVDGFVDINLLTFSGQSLLLLFVLLAAVVPEVRKDLYCCQPILL